MLVANFAFAQTNNSYPMIMSVRPTAAQIGQSTDVEVSARYNLAGASQVIVAGSGVTGEVLPDEKEKPEDRTRNDVMASKCKIRFMVASDVIPGVRDFRVITPHGASTVGQLVVARDAIVVEIPDNDTLATAQSIAIPATICGTLEKAEDVDFYKFTVDAGTSLTFHVRAQRLLNRIHDMQSRVDPLITLRSESGTTLAASDNYYAGDPLLHFPFERAGTYILEVRDVRYQGNADWIYSIEANNRPFITQAFPVAINPAQDTKLNLIGYNLPADPSTMVNVAWNGASRLEWISPLVGGAAANEIPVLVTDQPILYEAPTAAPVSAATDGTVAGTNSATEVILPAVLAGRIGASSEIDRFTFTAKAQERFSFEVIARRANSGLDPIMRILSEQGGVLVEADDGTFDRVSSSDSLLENWTAPADGKFHLEIRDLHQRGGPDFHYAVRATRAEPYFLLEADTDKTLLAPATNSVVFVKALRKNGFAGEIQLAVDGLPQGVTAVAGKIQPDLADGCIILQAAADAPIGAANIRIYGTAQLPSADASAVTLEASARPMQEYYSPGGGRGNYPVEMHTVSVANPMDVRSVKLDTAAINLKPGGSQKIQITVERAPDFTGNVTLDLILQHLEQPFGNTLPKGVKVDVGASKTLLTAVENTGFITLTAAPDTPVVENQLVPLNVHVSINFVVKHTICGPPLFVTVTK